MLLHCRGYNLTDETSEDIGHPAKCPSLTYFVDVENGLCLPFHCCMFKVQYLSLDIVWLSFISAAGWSYHFKANRGEEMDSSRDGRFTTRTGTASLHSFSLCFSFWIQYQNFRWEPWSIINVNFSNGVGWAGSWISVDHKKFYDLSGHPCTLPAFRLPYRPSSLEFVSFIRRI